MITISEARDLANTYLQSKKSKLEVVITDENTIEEDFGWIFFYQSKSFVESGIERYLLGGNAPIIVDKEDGAITVTGTRLDIIEYIKLYRKFRDRKSDFKETCLRYVP